MNTTKAQKGNKINGTNTTNAWSKPLTVNKPKNMSNNKTTTTTLTPPPGIVAENPSNATSSALRDRFLYLAQNLVGCKVEVSLLDGSVVEGIFHTFTPFPTTASSNVPSNLYVIKAVTVKVAKEFTSKVQMGDTLKISGEKVLCVTVKSMRLEDSSSLTQKFTDTEISNNHKVHEEKELVMASNDWVTPPSNTKMSLGKNIGKWDQFEANEQKFGVKATFDENLYTTSLDKSGLTYEQVKTAEKIAREIEKSDVGENIHMKEERGLLKETDFDEEDLYSGVLGKKDTVDATKEESAQNKVEVKTEVVVEEASNKEALENKTTKAEEDNKTEEKPVEETKPKSKLNPTAKEFTFNPGAKSFVPGGGAASQQMAAQTATHVPLPQQPMMPPTYVQQYPNFVPMQPGPMMHHPGYMMPIYQQQRQMYPAPMGAPMDQLPHHNNNRPFRGNRRNSRGGGGYRNQGFNNHAGGRGGGYQNNPGQVYQENQQGPSHHQGGNSNICNDFPPIPGQVQHTPPPPPPPPPPQGNVQIDDEKVS